MDLPLDLQSEKVMGSERQYELKCLVKVVDVSFIEVADGKQHETKSVLLIPDKDATETWMFFTAWLPEVSKVCLDCGVDNVKIGTTHCHNCQSTNLLLEWNECPTYISSPVESPARCAVLRKNSVCNHNHLFVMSAGVEDELRQLDGKTVYVRVFPGSEDHICDQASDINRTVK